MKRPDRTRALLALAVILVVAVAAVIAPAAQAGVRYETAKQAVGFLDQERRANGLSGGLILVPALSQGCNQYERQYVLAPEQYPHEELPSQPGYTKLGNEAASLSDLAEGMTSGTIPGVVSGVWGPTLEDNSWNAAPLHQSVLFDPRARYAWYGNGPHGECMGTASYNPLVRNGGAPNPPAHTRFYSLPGDNSRGVDVAESANSESPFSPQTAAHLGLGITGPDILLFAVGPEPQLKHVKLIGPGGQGASLVVVSPHTIAPNTGGKDTVSTWTGQTWYVIPRRPLVGNATYTLTAEWSGQHGFTHTQHAAFSTICSVDALGWPGPSAPFPGCPKLQAAFH